MGLGGQKQYPLTMSIVCTENRALLRENRALLMNIGLLRTHEVAERWVRLEQAVSLEEKVHHFAQL